MVRADRVLQISARICHISKTCSMQLSVVNREQVTLKLHARRTVAERLRTMGYVRWPPKKHLIVITNYLTDPNCNQLPQNMLKKVK